MAVVDADLGDSLRLLQNDTAVAATTGVAVDGFSVGEVLTNLYGSIITERLNVIAAGAASEIALVTLKDTFRLLDALYQARNVTLADAVGIAHSNALQGALQVIEKLRLSETVQGSAVYRMTLTQALRVVVSLGNFFGADIVEALGAGDDVFARALAAAALVDSVGVEAVLQPILLVSVVMDETIDIHSGQALQMLFNPTLIEGVEISAGMLEPNGSFTTWVMNTRTGAVTEYADYVFNSFAQVGDRWLGASDTGIYELSGDDDAGNDIIARIKGGYLQFGGTQLSRLKEAYIATTGEGEMILRIRTKDGALYNYGVAPRNGRSTKVHMGKGQRARYFAFELISTGQDFDLDTLEFVPLVVQRRV